MNDLLLAFFRSLVAGIAEAIAPRSMDDVWVPLAPWSVAAAQIRRSRWHRLRRCFSVLRSPPHMDRSTGLLALTVLGIFFLEAAKNASGAPTSPS